MEREFGEVSLEIEEIGISEKDEDIAIENPTVTISQAQKSAKKASLFNAPQKNASGKTGAVYQSKHTSQKTSTVWNAVAKTQKKKQEIFSK